jgi:hypothetical protein
MDRVARAGSVAQEVTEIWCADDTLARVRDYVSRTLSVRRSP